MTQKNAVLMYFAAEAWNEAESLTEEYIVMVNSEKLIGTTEYLTL
jgi:hypothetical protein